MKKLFLLLLVSGGVLSTYAQGPSSKPSDNHKRKFAADSLLSRVVVDINLLGGVLTNDYTIANTLGNYNNNIGSISNVGKLSFKNGMSYGFDAQLGVFFGRKRAFGLGLGFMYLAQEGEAKLDKFHVEYQSTDVHNNTFRQLLTANNEITENLKITNMNIPLVIKYKHRFSKRLGFTADLGALFNIQLKNSYTSDASFDYEAIYQLTGSGSNITALYDNSPVPNTTSDMLYTKAEHTAKNPNESLQAYFDRNHNIAGMNVGLGVKPGSNSGSVSYTTGSVGLLFQPSLNYFLSDNVALNIGGYYIYQPFTNDEKKGYMLTDKLGEYSSVLNTVKSANSQSYGLNLGVRIFVGKGRDIDHDGIADKDDRCPEVFGVAAHRGCPDTDGDGIADIDDECPRIPGLAKFNGCPDSDGDGIPDKNDACPFQAGPESLKGCPDRDGDGIADKDDLCPDKPGVAKYKGCPDTDGDGIPDNEDKCPEVAGPADNHGCPPPPPPPAPVEELKVTNPILFEVDRTVIQEISMPVIELAVKKLNEDKDSYVIVDGYTDNTGTVKYNRGLSLRRAQAVKNKLKSMGINPKRVKIVGHGASNPAAENDTEEGKRKNRRAVMHLTLGE